MRYSDCREGHCKMLVAKSWAPKTSPERRLVEDELNALLASPHFRNSKRYPALLKYVVEKSLDGQVDELKERTIGVEVFGRQPDYDTNADPVVRVTAGEVRKRIALFYHEAGEERRIQIDLPTGSYAPEFSREFNHSRPALASVEESLAETGAESEPPILDASAKPDAVESDERSEDKLSRSFPKTLLRTPFVLSFCVLAILAVLASYFVHRAAPTRQMEQLWAPLVQTQDHVLIVTGSGKPWLVSPESPQTSLSDHMIGTYHHVSLSDVIAISRLTNVLQKNNRTYSIKEASSTGMADLRGRTVILVGALNNIWTMQLSNALRFRFVPGTLARIQDTKNPQDSTWSVDYSKPYPSVSVDYGIVARYHDSYTNGNVLMIAGIGPYGTEAAGEFVSSPQYLSQIEHFVPAGFKEANLEMVLKTEVTRGEAGPPQLVAAYAF